MKWSMKWPNGNVLSRHTLFLRPYMVSCGAEGDAGALQTVIGYATSLYLVMNSKHSNNKKHSSRMCTAHLLTIRAGGGVSRGCVSKVCVCVRVWAKGVCPGRGVCVQEGLCVSRGYAHLPGPRGTPPCEQNVWQSGVKTLLCSKLRLRAVKSNLCLCPEKPVLS